MIKNVGIGTQIIQGVQEQQGGLKKTTGQPGEFQGVLQNEIAKSPQETVKKPEELLKFSSHALERIQHRGIRMMKEDVEKLNEAVDRASKKGSKDALVVMGENAFIVSVKNKTVVTAVDKNALKENVFTNIDSTIFA